jgi:hypothetical protein
MKDDIMSEENVEQYIQDAIKKYFDSYMLTDALFWKEAIRMLNNKHKKELK